jgi:hypothetical protein
MEEPWSGADNAGNERGSRPLERCLACEAVVNRANRDAHPISVSALCHNVFVGTGAHLAGRRVSPSMLFTTVPTESASQARQRSTGGNPFTCFVI